MKYFIKILILILIIITGCKTKDSQEQEVKKLLDRQAEMKDLQKESVEKIQRIQDSLALEKKLLLGERDRKNRQFKLLEKNQQALVEKLNAEEETDIASEKVKLQEKIPAYEDSIEQLKIALIDLRSDLDSIEKNIDFYELQKGQAKEIREEGIDEIDLRISKLENQKRRNSERANLIKRRISISDKRIEAFEMERNLYTDERDDLLRKSASREQLKPYLEKITDLDSTIRAEEANRLLLNKDLAQVEQRISDLEEMVADLRSKIKNEYDRTEIIESYIESEKQRLEKEIQNLKFARENLNNEQELISGERSRIDRKISEMDRKMELIKNRGMSDVLDIQADIEQSDADLAEEEIRNLQEATSQLNKDNYNAVTGQENSELKNLMEMSDQLDSLKASIENEKIEIINTRRELSEKRAEAATKRSRFSRTVGSLVLVLIIGSVGLLTLFYYLGKRARKS